MTLSMYFVVGDVKYPLELPYEVIDVTKAFVEAGYEELMETFIGDTKIVSKMKLINAIDFMIDSFESESDFLPYIYYIKYARPRGSDYYLIGAGFSTDIMIDGSRYMVEGGVNKCELTRSWQDEKGSWHKDNPIDVRDKDLIKTDSDGGRSDLIIIKTKKPLYFVDYLIELRELLVNAESVNEVKKILPLE